MEGLVNTNFGIERSKHGIKPRAIMVVAAVATGMGQDVPRWIVICKILIGRYWVSLNISHRMTGWDNYSSMKAIACGRKKNMHS